MEHWRGKVAVVTGASAGIGEAICELLVLQLRMNVVGLARRQDKLEELKNRINGKDGKFFPFKADITKEEDLLSAFQWVEKNLGGIHVMINNAGTTMKPTLVEATETSIWKTLYDTNVIGLQICSREAIKSMKAHNIDDGYIINISSIVSHMSSPRFGFVSYFASKKAVNAISEGLRVELGVSRSKIRVTNISPGRTRTEIFAANEINMPDDIPALESKDVAKTVKFLLDLPLNVLITEITLRDVSCTPEVVASTVKKM